MKATAIAPANIAFIKYWGKQDEKLHLPFNSSISMNLSGTYTTTTVDFSPNYEVDQVFFLESDSSHKIPRPLQVVCDAGEVQRVKIHLDQIRRLAQRREKAKIMTQNNFPKGGGIASSASGFAALTVAAVAALGLKLLQKELTMLARLGSGSACRSIPAGFVEWVAGGSSETSYAHSLYPEDYWDLRDVILIVSQEKKEVPTTAGMERIKTSPWWRERITAIPKRISRLKQAFEDKDFRKLGEVIEEDCLDMHWVMQTQNPPLFYWKDKTKEIMKVVAIWRNDGLPVYFTIDAGPNVHLICEGKNESEVINKVKTIQGVLQIIANKPAPGAHLVKEHLF